MHSLLGFYRNLHVVFLVEIVKKTVKNIRKKIVKTIWQKICQKIHQKKSSKLHHTKHRKDNLSLDGQQKKNAHQVEGKLKKLYILHSAERRIRI